MMISVRKHDELRIERITVEIQVDIAGGVLPLRHYTVGINHFQWPVKFPVHVPSKGKNTNKNNNPRYLSCMIVIRNSCE